jgi:hypothetical protein
MFDFENRLSADTCAQNVKEMANKELSNYRTYNYFGDCRNETLQKMAAECPNLHFRNGYGYANACTVDADSAMRFQTMTHGQERRQLNVRPFTAVPDMSRGCPMPDVESRLKDSQDTTVLRQCGRITEADFNRFTPLIGCVQDFVDGYAANNRFPVGEDTREHMRRAARSAC